MDPSTQEGVVAAVEEAARVLGATSDLVFARPSQVRARYRSHCALHQELWESLVALGVIPLALAESDARSFRTPCPCCRGRGTVLAYSEAHQAYLSSGGRPSRDPCPICCHTRRHYGVGWVETAFPLSGRAMAAVALRRGGLLDAEAAAREVGRRVDLPPTSRTVWWVDSLDRWPKSARRSMLGALARTQRPAALQGRKSAPSRRDARALDALGRRAWEEAYGEAPPPSPFDAALELRSLGADLVDVSGGVVTLFVDAYESAPLRSTWLD